MRCEGALRVKERGGSAAAAGQCAAEVGGLLPAEGCFLNFFFSTSRRIGAAFGANGAERVAPFRLTGCNNHKSTNTTCDGHGCLARGEVRHERGLARRARQREGEKGKKAGGQASFRGADELCVATQR